MLALQAVIGDCATLGLTNKEYKTVAVGPGGQIDMLVSADIKYYAEKEKCKDKCCWQDLKKAIDAGKVYTIGYTYSPDPNKNVWNPATDEVVINPNLEIPIWEIHPAGFLIARPIPLGPLLWHELIGHGVHGSSDHKQIEENIIDRNSPYYDPVIKIENMSRRCLGLNERVHQYYDNPGHKNPRPGDTQDYYRPVPPKRPYPYNGPSIGAPPKRINFPR